MLRTELTQFNIQILFYHCLTALRRIVCLCFTICCLLFSVEWESERLLSADMKGQEAVVAYFNVILWTLQTVIYTYLLYEYCIGNYPRYGVYLKYRTFRKLDPSPALVEKWNEFYIIGVRLDYLTPDIETGFLQRDQLSKIQFCSLPTHDGYWSFSRNGYFKCICRIAQSV